MNLKAFGADAGARPGYGEMGHTLDLDRLPEKPLVLDVGCRGFGFARDVLDERPEARIICLDPDPTIKAPAEPRIQYLHMALVGGKTSISGYVSTTHVADGGANFLVPLEEMRRDKYRHAEVGWDFTDVVLEVVSCINIQGLLGYIGALKFDAVKLDCEGSEFGILENWPGPVADQISVEFHDFTGPRREKVDAGYYEIALWPYLFQWYKIARHDWMDLDGRPEHLGHWDSLLVRK
jgi:hypothetical protein